MATASHLYRSFSPIRRLECGISLGALIESRGHDEPASEIPRVCPTASAAERIYRNVRPACGLVCRGRGRTGLATAVAGGRIGVLLYRGHRIQRLLGLPPRFRRTPGASAAKRRGAAE